MRFLLIVLKIIITLIGTIIIFSDYHQVLLNTFIIITIIYILIDSINDTKNE